jgi:hypothetical protein
MATTSLQVAKDLSRQLKSTEPDSQRCIDILNQLEKQVNEKAIAMHKMDVFLSILKKAQKSFRVQKRSASDKTVWDGLLEQTGHLIASLEALENSPRALDEATASSATMADKTEGLPASKSVYLSRLKNQKKELYKDPPVLPPSTVTIEETWAGPPKRNKRTHCLTFPCGQDDSLRELLKDFKPNQTPGEVLRAGAFGGTYFRSIVSAVTNQKYRGQDVVRDTIPNEWIKGLDQKMFLTSATYRTSINMFRAKCGGSLGMWEVSRSRLSLLTYILNTFLCCLSNHIMCILVTLPRAPGG